MKNKHFRHCDFIKVSKDVAENPKILKSFLIYFLSQPIQFKDKRRNVELYEITDLHISNNNLDDFIKETYTVIRTISYKTKKRIDTTLKYQGNYCYKTRATFLES